MTGKHFRSIRLAAAFLLAALAVPATAQAEPGGPDGANLQLHLFDCTGPAGTPTSFDVEFQVKRSRLASDG